MEKTGCKVSVVPQRPSRLRDWWWLTGLKGPANLPAVIMYNIGHPLSYPGPPTHPQSFVALNPGLVQDVMQVCRSCIFNSHFQSNGLHSKLTCIWVVSVQVCLHCHCVISVPYFMFYATLVVVQCMLFAGVSLVIFPGCANRETSGNVM